MSYFRHRDGGIYQVLFESSISSVDQSEWVIYEHVYPFEKKIWHRPKAEWLEPGRFNPIDFGEMLVLTGDKNPHHRAAAQAAIKAAKELRKSPRNLMTPEQHDLFVASGVGVGG